MICGFQSHSSQENYFHCMVYDIILGAKETV